MEESKEEILEKIKSLKKQLEDLNNQIIDFDLPKNYNQMSDEEKKAYQQRQDMLKKQALSDIENYSVIINDYTMVKYPEKRSIVPLFIRDVGSLSALPIERGTFTKTIPEKYKEQHKKNLEEIEKLIERYNSTKAIRNDRIEFGVNFNNFIQTYFNKQASGTIDAISNKRFLEKYDKTQDKNGNELISFFLPLFFIKQFINIVLLLFHKKLLVSLFKCNSAKLAGSKFVYKCFTCTIIIYFIATSDKSTFNANLVKKFQKFIIIWLNIKLFCY